MNSKESQVIFKFSTIQTYSYIGVGNHKSNLVHILYSYFSSNAKQPKNLVKRSYIISTHILRDMHYIYIYYTLMLVMYRVSEIEPFRPEINARNELNNMANFFPIYYPLGFPLRKIIIKLPKFCKIRRKDLFELHSTQLLKTMSIPNSHTQCHDITVYFFF